MSEKRKILKRVRNSAVIKNPLLFEAVGLCPVVAIAVSLKTALFLALLTALEMIVCELLTSLMLKNVRRYVRVALYFVFGIAIIFPIMYLAGRFLPAVSVDFGIFLPLMAVNSLIALHCERVAVKNTVRDSVIDALSASLSYGAVTVIVGFLRELLGSGSIGGFDVKLPVEFSAFLLPGGGLVILGFLAAALKALVSYKYPDKSPDRAFDTSEIRRSLRGSWRELMDDDYNPYGEDTETDSRPLRKEKPLKPKKVKKSKVENGQDRSAGKKEPNVENGQDRSEKKKKKKSKIPETTERERPVRTEERTYLDDFSDMLSELAEYKEKNEDGGDGE